MKALFAFEVLPDVRAIIFGTIHLWRMKMIVVGASGSSGLSKLSFDGAEARVGF
jgi:hypothetical protein